jgi:hypothetical protein
MSKKTDWIGNGEEREKSQRMTTHRVLRLVDEPSD